MKQPRFPLLFALPLCLFLFASCFTGVEGTKKITLTKDEKRAVAASQEELFFLPVSGTPLGEWQIGKRFMAADDKTVLAFDQEGLPPFASELSLGGDTLVYTGTETRITPAGDKTLLILLTGKNDATYRFNTSREPSRALSGFTSADIPMTIDLEMVNEARSLLSGKKLWTKTQLWYDSLGNRIDGRKFVPVTVKEVSAGNISFPLRIRFAAGDGSEAWAFMNFGVSHSDSRSFANLFMLSDIRKKYPGISDAAWDNITRGCVMPGMTKTECKLSLGNPSEVSAGHDYSQTLDLWTFPDGTALWFEDGVLTKMRR